MKTIKTLSHRMAALFLVVVVGLTALAPAASAAAIQLAESCASWTTPVS